jgi:hypothetical protein
LLNVRKHAGGPRGTRGAPAGFVDSCSSAPWFGGFERPEELAFGAGAARAEWLRTSGSAEPPVVAPDSWLLRVSYERGRSTSMRFREGDSSAPGTGGAVVAHSPGTSARQLTLADPGEAFIVSNVRRASAPSCGFASPLPDSAPRRALASSRNVPVRRILASRCSTPGRAIARAMAA